ncbi:fork head domain transcription factor slp1-like [Dreissena polymorpha]|uniref:Fork-head domain-containing protein n=1 Tax=Dreissena polymorpha TaxID=45954 RepID=A0A9D4EXR2_DREPO|nr:fork head domain transcription factor slp1-like [Dreissena polymorpha]KAH3787763.1 hypothetical protein DPMN_165892 [Dreissena polymorpha]
MQRQRFSIDYITGNAATQNSHIPLNMAQILFANHDGVATRDGANYLNNSLHLDDVYSVINNDLINDVKSSTRRTESQQPTISYKPYSNISCDDEVILTHVEIQGSYNSSEQLTTLSSPGTGSTSGSDVEPQERATPSPPSHDSGIESDHSPRSREIDLAKTLNALEMKALAVQTKRQTNPKSSSSSSTSSTSSSSDDKPKHSYIAMIVRAILSTDERRMSLSDIYSYIRDNYPFYDNEEKSWRNSIRYNLSINECFTKAGKEESGKGNYWAIHPNCYDDFKKGDYRRRQARRRARRNLKTVDSISQSEQPMHSTVPASYVQMTSTFPGYSATSASHVTSSHARPEFQVVAPAPSSYYYPYSYQTPQYSHIELPVYTPMSSGGYDYATQGVSYGSNAVNNEAHKGVTQGYQQYNYFRPHESVDQDAPDSNTVIIA